MRSFSASLFLLPNLSWKDLYCSKPLSLLPSSFCELLLGILDSFFSIPLFLSVPNVLQPEIKNRFNVFYCDLLQKHHNYIF